MVPASIRFELDFIAPGFKTLHKIIEVGEGARARVLNRSGTE